MSNFDCCFQANVFFVQFKNLYSNFIFDIMIMTISRTYTFTPNIDNLESIATHKYIDHKNYESYQNPFERNI